MGKKKTKKKVPRKRTATLKVERFVPSDMYFFYDPSQRGTRLQHGKFLGGCGCADFHSVFGVACRKGRTVTVDVTMEVVPCRTRKKKP